MIKHKAFTVEEYIQYLTNKGFHFREDALGFITFGQQYTKSTDELVNSAIEITLKVQKEFDGSFFVSLLESFQENNIKTREEAVQFAYIKNLM
ncbi:MULTISPECIES: DUF6123 family protein [Bacillaceae]|uniref:DUF6123 family protein n=1 Tax=Bacillaceae TaxID=186817 RepID=UPI001BDE2260|nr:MULTISPECIES: DUF6123 family protein [Bacillaceae]MDX8362931.1 DUF6123 family protein [Cytobacillus sp. IB215316]